MLYGCWRAHYSKSEGAPKILFHPGTSKCELAVLFSPLYSSQRMTEIPVGKKCVRKPGGK